MDRPLILTATVVSLAAVVAGVAIARPPSQSAVPSSLLVPVTTTQTSLTVHVSGSVVEPGLVTVPEGARVADAISAAGGATSGADLAQLNLAEPMSDGDRLHVPRRGEAMTEGPAEVEEGGLIAVNRASAAELQRLPGIGPVLAQRIVDHRERTGSFTTAEDLLDVPGIGERVLAGMRDLLVVP